MSEQVEPVRAERFRAPTVGGWLAKIGRPLVAFAVRQPMGAFSSVIIVLLILVAILAPVLAPSDPYSVDPDAFFIGHGKDGHILGGDYLGRDVLSRLIYGARISLYVSMVSCFFGIAVGSAVGIVSATRGGALDLILQRVIDALIADLAPKSATLLLDLIHGETADEQDPVCRTERPPVKPPKPGRRRGYRQHERPSRDRVRRAGDEPYLDPMRV